MFIEGVICVFDTYLRLKAANAHVGHRAFLSGDLSKNQRFQDKKRNDGVVWRNASISM